MGATDVQGAPHGQSRQLGLFQTFLCNSDDERQQLSNTFELWDSIPRYSISQLAMSKMREKRGWLDLLELDFECRGIRYNALIQAAQVKERTRDGMTRTIAYYPSANEELVEEALRKLAVDQKHGFYDCDTDKAASGVAFSLYQLRDELKQRGHARSFDEIKLSLSILSGSVIEILAYTPQGKKEVVSVKSAYLPYVASVTRRDRKHDPSARWLVNFHPLVTLKMNNLSYRQFNYCRLMKHTTQLARWLHRQLVLKYTFASRLKPFSMHFSTISRDSAMLGNYTRASAAQEACTWSMQELIEHGVLSKADFRTVKGARGKVLDVIYTLTPSDEFVAEVKAASKRLEQAKAMVGIGGRSPSFSGGMGGTTKKQPIFRANDGGKSVGMGGGLSI
jgi:hypothetical protein